MNLHEYVKNAVLTESRVEAVHIDPVIWVRLTTALISAGTLFDLLKKNVFYGKPVDGNKWMQQVNLLKEAANRLNGDEYLNLHNNDYVQYVDPRIVHAVVGLITEAVELLEALNEHASMKALDPIHLQEELGDLAWYQAIMVDALGADWEKILETNLAKLAARNKGKSFNAVATINRNVDVERKILEAGDARIKINGE